MAEGFELPETGEEHGNNPLVLPVSLTISILAVLVAAVTLLGHRTHTEELLLQSQATDRWAFYQAKNIRLHEMQGMVDLLGTITPVDKEKNAALREKYVKEVERYNGEKENISEKAKDLEKERDTISRRADRFDGGEALLEVGLVICSITLLTKRRAFWLAGIVVGALGGAMALPGLFLPGCMKPTSSVRAVIHKKRPPRSAAATGRRTLRYEVDSAAMSLRESRAAEMVRWMSSAVWAAETKAAS